MPHVMLSTSNTIGFGKERKKEKRKKEKNAKTKKSA